MSILFKIFVFSVRVRAREHLGLPLQTFVRAVCSHINLSVNICQSAAQINVKNPQENRVKETFFHPSRPPPLLLLAFRASQTVAGVPSDPNSCSHVVTTVGE